jgi:hypothetical protein
MDDGSEPWFGSFVRSSLYIYIYHYRYGGGRQGILYTVRMHIGPRLGWGRKIADERDDEKGARDETETETRYENATGDPTRESETNKNPHSP